MKKALSWILAWLPVLASAQAPAFLLEGGSNELIQLDVTTFDASRNGSAFAAPARAADLAWNERDQSLWVLLEDGRVGSLRSHDAGFRHLWTLGPGPWAGLAWSASRTTLLVLHADGRIFTLESGTGLLVSYSPFTAANSGFLGLACGSDGRVWAIFPGGMRLESRRLSPPFEIDNLYPSLPVHAIGFDRATSDLHATRAGDPLLYRVALQSGFLRALGPGVQPGYEVSALAFASSNGTALRFGRGCDAGFGAPPVLRLRGIPLIGQTMSLEMQYTSPGPIYFVRGISDSSWAGLPLPFDLGSLGAPGCRVLNSHDFLFGPYPYGTRFQASVPASSRLIGVRMYWQGYNFSSSVPNTLGLATSDAFHVVLGH